MFEYAMSFFPIFFPYKIGPIGVEAIVLLIGALCIFKRKECKIQLNISFHLNSLNKAFYILFFYVIIKDVCIIFFGKSDTSASVNSLVLLMVHMVSFILLTTRKFDLGKFYNGLKVAGIIYTIGTVYHLIQIYVFKQNPMPISLIPGYEISPIAYSRPRSFFSEPAALAQAMLPLLFFSLNKRDYKYSLMATFTIVASTSTMGIVLAAVLWLFEFVLKSGKIMQKIMVIIVFLALGALLYRSEVVRNTILSLQERASGGGSTAFRVSLGFDLIATLTHKDYLFGTLYHIPYDYAVDNLQRFSSSSLLFRATQYGADVFFVNALSNLIFRYGFIGLYLYFQTYKGKLFDNHYSGRSLAIMTIIEMIGDTMLFNAYYFYIMLLLYYLKREQGDVHESITYRIWPWKPNARLL